MMYRPEASALETYLVCSQRGNVYVVTTSSEPVQVFDV